MANRSEEKARRREERLVAEQAAARTASRRRMLQLGAIGGVVLAVVAIVLVVALAGGSKGADTAALASSATAAGCTFKEFESEGSTHTADKVTYKTNPATSGNHDPTPGPDGVYAAGNEPEKENWVHTLEHGRILFQYAQGASAADVAKLRALYEESYEDSGAGYHAVLMQNNTQMPAKFAAVAWTRYVTCDTLTPQALAVMRDFRNAFTDKAPEFIP